MDQSQLLLSATSSYIFQKTFTLGLKETTVCNMSSDYKTCTSEPPRTAAFIFPAVDRSYKRHMSSLKIDQFFIILDTSLKMSIWFGGKKAPLSQAVVMDSGSLVVITSHEWSALYCVTLRTRVNRCTSCNSTPREPLTHTALCRERLSYPTLTWTLGSASLKPVIVSGLITDAQSATPSLGLDNGASVFCLDRVGTSDMSLPNCHACVSVSRVKQQTVVLCGIGGLDLCVKREWGTQQKHSCSVDAKKKI